jgi:2-oxoisovalerate dehydrogenase E1 component
MSAITLNHPLVKIDFLRMMMESREGDRREGILLRQSKGWFQVSGMGHEAIGALCHLLNQDDFLFPYYRDRGLMMARGMTTKDLALAYLAKRDSSSGGRQMPGHYSSRKLNVGSVCTPTGGGLIPAAGVAWGMQLDGKDNVVIATVGDAAMRQGEFYEAWAFAVQEKLPLIIVIEDNKYGISTPTAKFMALNHEGIIARDFVIKADGRTVESVLEAGNKAISKARAGDGPSIIWFDLDRLSSHTSSDDHRTYRDADEIAEMADRDPIKLLKEELIAKGELTEDGFQKIQEEVIAHVDAIYREAESADDPRADEFMDHLWGAPDKPVTPPINSGNQTMVEAINLTLDKALASDQDIIFFGEDIEDPKGGVFKLTENLSTKYPKQVFNSPLAEATIIGVAVGLSMYGKRPVFELQFVDFFCPAMNQIMSNVSTTRWRSFGEWPTPMTVYAPYGAYLPGGSLWHSQSNEAYFAHTPGLKVAIPSTPEDAAGLFWTAIHSEDPCFIFVPKHIFRKRVDVNSVEPLAFGKAKVVRSGTDLTIVTYGNTLELAAEAADKLAGEASVEIIDIRSLVPLDTATIAASLEKTGRLVVIQEDTKTCGFGQHILSEVVSNPETFGTLFSSPQLVSRPDIHIGYNPIYEYAALPDINDVLTACRTALD